MIGVSYKLIRSVSFQQGIFNGHTVLFGFEYKDSHEFWTKGIHGPLRVRISNQTRHLYGTIRDEWWTQARNEWIEAFITDPTVSWFTRRYRKHLVKNNQYDLQKIMGFYK